MALRTRIRSRIPPAVAYAVQLGLAVGLVAIPVITDEPWLFYTYYGAGIVVVPAVVWLASGHALSTLQRLYVSAGLAIHPYSIYAVVYPHVPWWDVLTHLVSASLLAAGLYALFLGIRGDRSSGLLAGRRIHAWTLALVLAGAVAWEFYEVAVPWLTVYGPADTAKDLVVGLLGWAVVARYAPRLLGDVPVGVSRRLGQSTSGDPDPTASPLVEVPSEDRADDHPEGHPLH